MQFVEILLIAFALSLDSFAVSLAASSSGLVKDKRAAFRLSFHFGLFQFLMPMLGWALGTKVEPFVVPFDHWIAFFLLVVVGLRMIRSTTSRNPQIERDDPSRGVTLVVLALATSIDALAIGLSIAMAGYEIWYPSFVIGGVTAMMCLLAIVAGNHAGGWMGERARWTGGLILILIGARIVVSHLLASP
jgi:manganese efflux pump family protein